MVMVSLLPSLPQSFPHPHPCNSTYSFLFRERETKKKGIPKENYPNMTISINCRQDYFFLVSVDLDNAQRKTNYFQVLNIKTGE